MADALAECVPGHWESDVGAKLAAEYADKRRSDLAMAQLPDFALANAQFECSRFDLSLIGYQTAAKERIRWLSAQLACTIEALEIALRQLRVAVIANSGGLFDEHNVHEHLGVARIMAAIAKARGEV